MNSLRSGVPIATLTAPFLGPGTLLGGGGGMALAPVAVLGMTLSAYGNADTPVPRRHGASVGSRRARRGGSRG